jgi:hypothetical protein
MMASCVGESLRMLFMFRLTTSPSIWLCNGRFEERVIVTSGLFRCWKVEGTPGVDGYGAIHGTDNAVYGARREALRVVLALHAMRRRTMHWRARERALNNIRPAMMAQRLCRHRRFS